MTALKTNKLRFFLAFLGVIMMAGSLWQLQISRSGLVFESGTYHGLPYELIHLEDFGSGKRPLVLLAHGLAGSGTIMEGLALTFAHAGYVVATWDFDGHAGNSRPMQEDIYSPWLLDNVETVFKAVSEYEQIDTGRVAIVGHSMGTAAALRFGQTHSTTMATIAISPVGTKVTRELPKNLLLLAGQLEPDFVDNARKRLDEAGGVGGDPVLGTARDFQIIPGVEHISIIFSPATHAIALHWLDSTFGVQEGAQSYRDSRLLWFGLVVMGTLLLASTAIPRYSIAHSGKHISLNRRILILLGSAISTTLILWLVGLMGLPLTTLFGIRAGGYLILWFLVAGVIGVITLKSQITIPNKQEVAISAMIFSALWLGIGLTGGGVWLPWLLIPSRLILWPLVALALLPWCWLVGTLSNSGKGGSRLIWWAGHSVVLFGALMLAIRLSPSLGFLMLLLPVFPLVLLFHVIPNLGQRGSWIFALSGALFVSWMLLAVFPLI